MNSIIRKEVLKMIDQLRELFKNSSNTWLKVISMIAAILYVIIYMCSCRPLPSSSFTIFDV